MITNRERVVIVLRECFSCSYSYWILDRFFRNNQNLFVINGHLIKNFDEQKSF
ncbi:hypothetical protein RV02_GL003232 [Enterococcus gilvus]|nr:hypothetical protein RV02_GL003232 [Enterococcus gilvus]